MRLIDADKILEDVYPVEIMIVDKIRNAPTVDFGVDLDRLKELAEADKEGRCLVLPCKVGDTINAFRFDMDKGLYVISDKVTSVTTNRNGYTIKTKEKFYPIKEKDGYDFAPISEYPGALADYYVGTKEEAEKALEGLE